MATFTAFEPVQMTAYTASDLEVLTDSATTWTSDFLTFSATELDGAEITGTGFFNNFFGKPKDGTITALSVKYLYPTPMTAYTITGIFVDFAQAPDFNRH